MATLTQSEIQRGAISTVEKIVIPFSVDDFTRPTTLFKVIYNIEDTLYRLKIIGDYTNDELKNEIYNKLIRTEKYTPSRETYSVSNSSVLGVPELSGQSVTRPGGGR